jgi:bacterioferritin-associated ferredoxin
VDNDRWLCECNQVSRETVAAAIADGADLVQLMDGLGCGTDCGSCVPELKQLLGCGPPPAWPSLRVPALVAAGVVLLALVPPLERVRAKGPANTGHDDLACAECHLDAPGSVRQQLQANTRKLFGLRETWAPLVHAPVRNAACEHCHDREGEDRHPPFRFTESRFEDARAAIAPTSCTSCHQEHRGGRVTRDGDYCTHCHQEFELDADRVEPSHQQLADDERFDTCLQCHDFHGNHLYTLPETLDEGFELDAVQAYLEGGPSPYGADKRFEDRTTRAPDG